MNSSLKVSKENPKLNNELKDNKSPEDKKELQEGSTNLNHQSDPIFSKENELPLANEIPFTRVSVEEVNQLDKKLNEMSKILDETFIPSQVKISMELDKKNFINNNALEQKSSNSSNSSQKGATKSNKIKKRNPAILFFKLGFGSFLILVFLFICYLLMSVLNIDTKFVKLSLTGYVTSKTDNNFIQGAQIYVNDNLIATTNKDGSYNLNGLDLGTISLTIKADGFNDDKEDIQVSKTVFSYTTRKDFILTSSKQTVLNGKLISNMQNYKFSEDKLTINDQNITINNDGSFSSNNIKVGDSSLSFTSNNFKTLNQTITLKPGTNQIQPITLLPAGQLTGELKSYIREDLVLNAQFFIENTLQTQVSISKEGTYLIKDLDINKTYKIRITANGYQTRDYQLLIKQGINSLPGFKLVENGNAVFIQNNNSYSNNFFKSDLDGNNIVQITNINNLAPLLQYYDSNSNRLYFLSPYENFSTVLSNNGILNLPYFIDLSLPNKINSLVNSKDKLGQLYANFRAKKMVNLTQSNNSDNTTTNKIQLIDTQNVNVIDIKSGSDTFSNFLISDNGKAVVYLDKSDKTSLYRFNADTSNNIQISSSNNLSVFDISEDGNRVLFTRLNDATGLNDLVMYDSTSSQIITLKENFSGAEYQFLKGDNNKIIYFTSKINQDNIYQITINLSKDDRITTLSGDYKINHIYQESGWIYYYTNKGLLIFDINKPQNFKQVTDKIEAYSGYKTQ